MEYELGKRLDVLQATINQLTEKVNTIMAAIDDVQAIAGKLQADLATLLGDGSAAQDILLGQLKAAQEANAAAQAANVTLQAAITDLQAGKAIEDGQLAALQTALDAANAALADATAANTAADTSAAAVATTLTAVDEAINAADAKVKAIIPVPPVADPPAA